MPYFIVTVMEMRQYEFDATNLKEAEKIARGRVLAPNKIISLEQLDKRDEPKDFPPDAA